MSALPVTLEPRTAAHAEALYALLADPSIYAFLDERPPVSVEALRVRFARSENLSSPDGSERWLNWVARDAAGCIAGFVQATVEADGNTNIAYVFGTAFRGRGIARAAVAQMLRLLAADHGVANFFVVADRRNYASIRLAEGLGFAPSTPAETRRRGVAGTDLLLEKRQPQPAPEWAKPMLVR